MNSSVERDKIAEKEGVVAFEMEGAGVSNNLPFILVKGVCDYADSHKDKYWQKYTAGRAAACMKSLLEQWPAIDSAEGITERQSESSQALVSQPPPIYEGHPSPKGHDPTYKDLLQFLPVVKLGFKSALACFKAKRKCLPRDANLKSLLKTQRVVFLEALDTMSSSSLKYANDDLNSSNKLHLEGAQAIQTKLEEIEDITNSLPVVCKSNSPSRSDVDKLKDALEDLASMVQVFVSLMPQPRRSQSLENSKIATSLSGCREFRQFQLIQQAACSLYDAFGTACNAHTVHDVHLSLQPGFDHPSSRVQFNVAYSQVSMAPGKAIWIKVESKINPSEVTPQSRSLPIRDSQSLKRKVHFEDSPSEVRNQVRVQTSRASLWSLCPKEPFSGIPNIHLQRNLCTLMNRLSRQKECNGCIGSLGGNVICTHLAYMDHQADDKSTSTSLAQLISLSGADPVELMSFYEKIRLCRYLATAVLYYHATPWLTKAWRSDDIHFFGNVSSLQRMPSNLLYIAMATSVQVSGPSISSQPQSSNYHHIVRNPVFFGLGVMFLELAYDAPLKALQKPVDLEKGDSQGFADYFTAHRVADSGREVTGTLKAIIKKCLYCDFGHDSDFASSELQQAFFHEVIGGLEKLEAKLQEI